MRRNGRIRHLYPTEPGKSVPIPSWRAPIHPDVARVEDRTFICSESKVDAGHDQQLGAASENARQAEGTVQRLHAGRTLYVIPFSMGPIGSPIAQTDRLGLRRGQYEDHDPHGPEGARHPGQRQLFVPCVHSVGAPLAPVSRTCPGRASRISAARRSDAHFETRILVLRFRLRRQRPAWQEVPGAAHRLVDGPR